MRNLIPHSIAVNFRKNNYQGSFEGGVMFVDTSGFTRMTQELMKNGQEGAELIAQAINDIFTPAVNNVYQNYGYITHFAGDAFNAVFPGEKNGLTELLISAWENREKFKEAEIFRTKFGDYPISVKIGLAYGEISWRIVNQANVPITILVLLSIKHLNLRKKQEVTK
jgi:class 3 adenylate cyclase